MGALDFADRGFGNLRPRERHDEVGVGAGLFPHRLADGFFERGPVAHLRPWAVKNRQLVGVVAGRAHPAGGSEGDVHSVYAFDHRLDLVAVEIGAVDDDHVLFPAGDRQPAGAQHALVTGLKPAVGGERFLV